MLSPFNLPQGTLLLITDELSAPADFLLHRTLLQHLKENSNSDASCASRAHTATILSVSEGLARWNAIASRSNLNLNLDNHHFISPTSTSNVLEFVNVLSHTQVPQRQSQGEGPSLKPVFDLVLNSLKRTSESSSPSSTSELMMESSLGTTTHRRSHLVILDDISSLEWIGFSLLDVMRFTRMLRAACLKAGATLVVRHHRVSDEPDELFSHLYQLCTYHLEVKGLASGRSGSVSGEIALHAGPATIPKDIDLLPRSRAMQYRLTEASAIFFEKGTGGVVP